MVRWIAAARLGEEGNAPNGSLEMAPLGTERVGDIGEPGTIAMAAASLRKRTLVWAKLQDVAHAASINSILPIPIPWPRLAALAGFVLGSGFTSRTSVCGNPRCTSVRAPD
jgi:hypothetical protein